MDKDKVSYYASYVAIACGVLIVATKLIDHSGSNFTTYSGIMFVIIGAFGLRRFRNKQ